MPRIPALRREDLPEAEPLLAHFERTMGFVPNSLLTLGHQPAILEAAADLGRAVLGPGDVPIDLKFLVGHLTSHAAGCRYCQAHTAHSADRAGTDPDKLAAVYDYETHSAFDDAERAALRVAHHAGLSPNAVTDEDFAELQSHWTPAQMVEIMAVVALYGFLNRWNDSVATSLEAKPQAFGASHLQASGWEAGKHAAERKEPA